MDEALKFIKKHRFDIIVTCSVIAFIFDVYTGKHTFSVTIIALYILGYAADNEKNQNDAATRRNFIPRGLTTEDLENIKFVKSWDDTRKSGLIKYSLINGGLFFGFALCFAFSLFLLFVTKSAMIYISAGPGNMINFISYTYVAGMIGGTILFRLLWSYNEQKFIKLTDPFQ